MRWSLVANSLLARSVVKGSHGSADLREGASEEKTVPRIVEPPRCAARMRQRDVRDPLDPSRRPDRDFEAHLPPEAFDRETADEQDHARSKERELLLEPRRAQADLRWRWPTIAATRRRFSRETLRDRCSVRQVILVDARAREPAAQLRSGASAERLAGRELDRAGCLPDDGDTVENRTGDDGPRMFEETCVDASRADADPSVKTFE